MTEGKKYGTLASDITLPKAIYVVLISGIIFMVAILLNYEAIAFPLSLSTACTIIVAITSGPPIYRVRYYAILIAIFAINLYICITYSSELDNFRGRTLAPLVIVEMAICYYVIRWIAGYDKKRNEAPSGD